jgi:23S rRNA pseudouridine1911/1915/1917 synthase
MIVAKTDHAHHYLSAQLQDRSLSRIYEALVVGVPFQNKGEIEGSIGRHPTNRLRMAIVKNGRDALTYYQIKQKFSEALSLVECRLATGRTHQIRVHFEKIKHPLVGDPLYGIQPTGLSSIMKKNGFNDGQVDTVKSFPRQALHARAISFIHPETEEVMSFDSDLPEDMQKLIEAVNN